MAGQPLTDTLQESILATLIFDEKWGAAIATQIRARDFDDPFREIAEKVLEYRKKYRKAPGRTHIDDLLSQLFSKKGRETRTKRILMGLAQMEKGLNGEYIANEVQTHIRKQKLKTALLEAGERFDQGGAELVPDVENIMQKALHFRTETLDAGTFLTGPGALSFLDVDESDRTVPFGIAPWDKAGIHMASKEMTLLIGPKGSGKTWFCVHAGKQGLLLGENVVHITIENKERSVAKRYVQSMFSMSRRRVPVQVTRLDVNRRHRFMGIKEGTELIPSLTLSDPNIKKKLRRKIRQHGGRLGRLVIKEFPTGYLSISQLEAYLDFLEMQYGFIATMCIVDYLDLMRITGDYRFGVRANTEGLRGLFQKRNLIGVCPTHGSRKTIHAKRTTSKDVAEDISKVNAADKVLTYSQTSEEKDRKLARLTLEHSRETEDDQTVILAQNYDIGQYVMDAALFPKEAGDYFKEVGLSETRVQKEDEEEE